MTELTDEYLDDLIRAHRNKGVTGRFPGIDMHPTWFDLTADALEKLRYMRASDLSSKNEEQALVIRELVEALDNLMGEVEDIRGLEIEEYKPAAFARARAAIAKAKQP